jgi:hypothetical protein
VLLACGVDPNDIALGMVGVGAIRLDGALYEPDPDHGKPAFISPVRIAYADTPESAVPASAVRVGAIVDLIGWHPLRPDRWALRTGAAEWLGAIEPQYMDPAPVPIRHSVLGWFQARCEGMVSVSRARADVYRLLRRSLAGWTT